MVGCTAQTLPDLFYFQLHDVVLHQHFFLPLGDFVKVLDGHVILQGQLLDLRLQFFLAVTNAVKFIFDCPEVVVQFLDTFVQYFMLVFDLVVILRCLFDIFLEVFFLFKGPFSLGPRHLSSHELDLILCIVQ